MVVCMLMSLIGRGLTPPDSLRPHVISGRMLHANHPITSFPPILNLLLVNGNIVFTYAYE